MTKSIVGTFNRIPKLTSSHSYGWARTWSENLDIPLDNTNGFHDEVYLLHGANFGGNLNLFGGFTDELKKSIDNLMMASTIISLDIECPDYGAMLKPRKDVKELGLESWCDDISQRLSGVPCLISSDLPYDTLAIGDSHTAAYSDHNSSVIKKDGTTLNSQINSDFEYIRSHIKPHHKNITISLGNIDIRHHICRVNANIPDMIAKYAQFVKELESNGLNVEVSIPWPIEFEDRKLPKTGYYKDQPFWGTREERIAACKSFYNELKSHNISTVSCPKEWYSIHPTKFAKEYMEAKQSVHMNPCKYRRMNWGESNSLMDFF